MLTVTCTHGRFVIPDTEPYSITTGNRRTVHYRSAQGEERLREYGDLIFETPRMKCVFRKMENVDDFLIEELDPKLDGGKNRLYIDAFDPRCSYEDLEIQMR